MKYLLAATFLLSSFYTTAEIVNTQTGTIDRVFAYDDYGAIAGRDGADVIAWFQTGVTGCKDGVWLSPSAPGYNTITSFLLTAYTTNQTVRFQIYNDQVWAGSDKSQFCKIDAIRFE